ncbi:unnamed protein product, partial [marine sediment metagenome]
YPVEIGQEGFKALEEPTHYVWIQSEQWEMQNGRFEDQEVKLGTGDEDKPWLFEIWLIAIRPQATVRLEEYQAWLASALPEGCVRAASMRVVKIPTEVEERPEPERNLQVAEPVTNWPYTAVTFCFERGGETVDMGK